MLIEESPAPAIHSLVEDFFRSSFSNGNPIVSEAVQRMLSAGGKRLRPRITLLAAETAGGNVADHLHLAAYIELIHVATLIHDDVVDNAQTRRGINATAVDYGNRISVLAGDYLFAWIFKNITESYPPPVPNILSSTLAEICDGEVLQLRALSDVSLSIPAYVEIVSKKTASLFAAGARCGAIVSRGDSARIQAVGDFGLAFGIAFQMKDDLLDVTAETGDLGKPVGNDLRERKMTIPLLLALQLGDSDFRTMVERYFSSREERHIPAILRGIEDCGGIDGTRKEIARYVAAAKLSLDALEESRAKSELQQLADNLVKEKS